MTPRLDTPWWWQGQDVGTVAQIEHLEPHPLRIRRRTHPDFRRSELVRPIHEHLDLFNSPLLSRTAHILGYL